ncbi:hypothetical protein RJT34_15733 [Clitoria ternatea]|uniref:Uncharacterized protein n=1 Tax=Clitoria ternatea TaxID=43366 RepID=A0AAN9PBP8_CLITE
MWMHGGLLHCTLSISKANGLSMHRCCLMLQLQNNDTQHAVESLSLLSSLRGNMVPPTLTSISKRFKPFCVRSLSLKLSVCFIAWNL